jgi:hypothetical protein
LASLEWEPNNGWCILDGCIGCRHTEGRRNNIDQLSPHSEALYFDSRCQYLQVKKKRSGLYVFNSERPPTIVQCSFGTTLVRCVRCHHSSKSGRFKAETSNCFKAVRLVLTRVLSRNLDQRWRSIGGRWGPLGAVECR